VAAGTLKPMTARLRLWEIDVPFRRPLRTAHGVVDVRSSVIVALDADDHTGWAEAPAFPSGRFGTASHAFDDLAEPAGWVGSLPNVPIASAAYQGAAADLTARAHRIPLHEHLGARGRPVVARHPIGLGEATDVDREAGWLRSHDIAAVKIKISPDADLEPIRALRAAMPGLDIGVDANESYTDPSDPTFAELDLLGVSFVEQPFPAGDLASHARLRDHVRMAVCLDESITNIADVRRVVAAGAADQIAVKLNRLGLDALLEILELASRSGVGVQLGGTFDTSIGRRHLLAASGLPGIVDAAVGPPAAYLSNELAPYPALVDGTVQPDGTPGIGATPDQGHLDSIALRTATVGL
jgi:O-succinylbenzoate synthase